MSPFIAYEEMVERYGADGAYDLLVVLENMAKTKEAMTNLDEADRLQRAFEALDVVTAA